MRWLAVLGVPLLLGGCSCGETPEGSGPDASTGRDGGTDGGDPDDGGPDAGVDGGLDAGPPPVCGNGVLEPGDLCYPSARFLDIGEDPRAVEAGDVDGDERVDLAVAHGDPPVITLLLGDGAGGFALGATLDLSPFLPSWAGPLDLALGDANEDGVVDLFAPAGDLLVLLGTGGGAFEDPRIVPAAVISVELGDFDADGHVDMAGGSRESVQVFLGDGAGGFEAGAVLPADDPYHPASGDLDGDGLADLVVGTGSTGSSYALSLYWGDGAGGFSAGPSLRTVEHPDRVVPADLDGDGDLDLAAYYSDSDIVFVEPLDGAVVFLNDGAGELTAAPAPDVGDATEPVHLMRLVALDVDGDDAPDLVTANAGLGDVGVHRGDGAGAFPWDESHRYLVGGAGPLSNAPAGPVDVAGADFDGDGDVDLATVGAAADGAPAGAAAVLAGDGTGRFGGPSTIGWVPGLRLLTSADFDGDGAFDLAFYNFFCAGIAGCFEVVSVALQQDGRFFSSGTALDTFLDRLQAADVDGDGDADLVGLSAGDGVIVLRGDGTGALGEPEAFAAGTSAIDLAIADLDADGELDFATANGGSGDVSVLLGDGAGGFAAGATEPVGDAPTAIVAGDFDGDGTPDLAVAHAVGVTVLVGDGAGGFALGATLEVTAPADLDAADLDRDGDLDLVVADPAITRVFFGGGTGDFPDSAELDEITSEISIADLDADGAPDLLLPDARGRIALVRNAGDGRFSTQQHFLAGKGGTGVRLTVRDFDGDSAPDLVIADPSAGALRAALATP